MRRALRSHPSFVAGALLSLALLLAATKLG